MEDGSPNDSLDADAVDVDAPLITTTERKLMAKVDLHVVPVLTILYLLAFLDRVNIGNARIFGLEDDLGLTGTQYNTALTIFFVPYVVFEVCYFLYHYSYSSQNALTILLFFLRYLPIFCLRSFAHMSGVSSINLSSVTT